MQDLMRLERDLASRYFVEPTYPSNALVEASKHYVLYGRGEVIFALRKGETEDSLGDHCMCVISMSDYEKPMELRAVSYAGESDDDGILLPSRMLNRLKEMRDHLHNIRISYSADSIIRFCFANNMRTLYGDSPDGVLYCKRDFMGGALKVIFCEKGYSLQLYRCLHRAYLYPDAGIPDEITFTMDFTQETSARSAFETFTSELDKTISSLEERLMDKYLLK